MQATYLAGNCSALSGGLVVHLIDVVPPWLPVLTGVYGGDRQVTMPWAANREPDLALYRLYRTGDPASAADVRTMPLVAAFLLDPAMVPGPRLLHGRGHLRGPGGRRDRAAVRRRRRAERLRHRLARRL